MQSPADAILETMVLPDLEGLEPLSLSPSRDQQGVSSGADNVRVGIDRTEAVAVVQLNRPAKRNALTQAMINRLVAVLGQLDQDDAVRTVVLIGTRKGAFSGQSMRFHLPVSHCSKYIQ